MLIGYARCSTDKQDLAAQRAGLASLGVGKDRIYLDYAKSAKSRAGRDQLEAAISALRDGDVFVVTKLDRMARSVPDARKIAEEIQARGAALQLGSSTYDPGDAMGKMFFNILATFAEFERDIISQRTREGMAIAREKGKLRGKQPKLSAQMQAVLVREYCEGEKTVAELATMFEISRPAVYRCLERAGVDYRATGRDEACDGVEIVPEGEDQ